MPTPNPAPLSAALKNLETRRAEIAALHQKGEELKLLLVDVDPTDDAAVSAAMLRQTQAGLIPQRVERLEAALEPAVQILFQECESFARQLKAAAAEELAAKLRELEAFFLPFFADGKDPLTGEIIKRARGVARGVDQFNGLPLDQVGEKKLPEAQPRTNNPAWYDGEVVDRARELLAIHQRWQANSEQFGRPLPALK